MSDVAIEEIAGQNAATQTQLLALNNRHANETSHLTPDKWRELVAAAFVATCLPEAGALLLAFDERAAHDSANFNWFAARLTRFVYVDRIVVDPNSHGRGIARRLYEDLFARARAISHDHVVCEVNRIPPNPGSDRFHARMGFARVGEAVLAHNGRTVRYLARRLDGEPVRL